MGGNPLHRASFLMLALVVAVVAALAASQGAEAKASSYPPRCAGNFKRGYCSSGKSAICALSGYYDYSKCSSGCRGGWVRSQCQYGTPWCQRSGRGYRWNYSTCYKSRCHGNPDWSQCPYGGYPYCGFEDGKYSWQYDKCSYCDPTTRSNTLCSGDGSSQNCLYDISAKKWGWTCTSCSGSPTTCGSGQYSYCQKSASNYKWGCE